VNPLKGVSLFVTILPQSNGYLKAKPKRFSGHDLPLSLTHLSSTLGLGSLFESEIWKSVLN